MSEVTVRANQTTTDFVEGSVFTVERTDYLDKLIDNGVVSVHIPDGDPLVFGEDVVLGEKFDQQALTDDDAKAAGFDLDNPDALPAAADVHEQASADIAASIANVAAEVDEFEAEEKAVAEEKPSSKRGSAKKSDDASG